MASTKTLRSNSWTPDEVKLLRDNYAILGYDELRRLFPNRSRHAIFSRASILGIARTRSQAQSLRRFGYRRHHLNDAFFDVPTPVNAYWAGFIAADGCLTFTPTPMVKLALNGRDAGHLERLATDIGFEGRVKIERSGVASLSLTLRPVTATLLTERFKITPRKSLTLQPPDLSEDLLIMAYIIGYIDGDGAIGIDGRDGAPRIGIRGTFAVLSWIKEHFERWLAQRTPIVSVSDQYPKYQLSHTKARAILEMLMSVDVPRLTRKWGGLPGQERFTVPFDGKVAVTA